MATHRLKMKRLNGMEREYNAGECRGLESVLKLEDDYKDDKIEIKESNDV